jgi:hypothetical protein
MRELKSDQIASQSSVLTYFCITPFIYLSIYLSANLYPEY